MRYFITILLFLTTCLFPSDKISIENIPIQEFGRIKPLDTFARNNMLSLYGKRTLKHESLSAIEWMTMLFTNTDSAFNKDVFNINSPEIVYASGATSEYQAIFGSFFHLKWAFAFNENWGAYIGLRHMHMDKVKLEVEEDRWTELNFRNSLFLDSGVTYLW